GRRGASRLKELKLLRANNRETLTARTASDAQVELDAAMGQGADLMPQLISSSPHFQSQFRTYESNLGNPRAATGMRKTLLPEDEGFVEAWADEINKFRTSPVVRRIAEGMSDEEIHRWLTRTLEGRQVAKRIPWRSH